VAPELIACIREARHPTIHELGRLAERIRTEIYGAAPAFAWAGARDERHERLMSLRFAQAALLGSMVVVAARPPTPTPMPVIEQVAAIAVSPAGVP
jgi:hypothetical protein